MPKYDERIPGSITKTSDSQLERISEISNVNRTITEMQRKIDQEVSQTIDEVDKYEGIKDVQNSLSKVLNIMGNTVGNIGKGFTKIASETSKASADAIKQYGRAITQDININKQNLLAMTLARSTPIFGYFAAKFMETDVFKRAREKMSENIAAALGSLTSKFRQGFTGFVSRIRGKRKGGKEDLDKISEEYNIPKMQRGGVVKKEGLAHLHAGEAIMPIEKILDRIDESISLSRNLAQITTRTQMNMLTKMDRFISYGADTSKKNIFSAFISAAGDVHRQYEQPAEMRMLRALLAIQDALGAQIGKWSQVWQKVLMEHPMIRQTIFFLKTIGHGIALPGKIIYSFFKPRGGYQNQVSRSRNPMEAVAQNAGILYVGSMWRLDNIAKFTRASAEATRDLSSAITGKQYPALEGVPRGLWSIAGLGIGLLKFVTKHGTKFTGKLLGYVLDSPEVENFFNKIAIQIAKPRQLPAFGRAKEMRSIYGKGTPTQIPDIDQQQIQRAEKREQKKVRNEIKLIEYMKDIEENTGKQTKISKLMWMQKKAEMMYGIGKSVWKTISSLIGPLLMFAMGLIRNPKKTLGFITRPFIRGLGKMFLGFIGRLSSAVVSGLSRMFVFSKDAIKKILPRMGGKIGAIAGRAGGRIALPLLLIMGAFDIVTDFISGFKEGGILSGLRKALMGKKEGGLMNAFKTSGKWAAIGAAIGIIGGPPGILIGGIIGTVIGGVIGFFGSDRIKKGISKISKGLVGKFLSGLWFVIKKIFSFGWKIIKGSAKGVWKAIKWVGTKVAEIVSWPFRKLYSLMQLAGEFIKEKLQNTPVIGWVLDKTGILPRDQSSKIQEIQQKEEKSWWAKAKSAVPDKKTTDVAGINFSGIGDFDHSGTIDKGKDTLVKSADLLKEGYTQGMSQAQVLQSLENISDKLDKASDKISTTLESSATFVTTNVTNQMNNTTQAISNMGSRGKEKMSRYSERVLRGSLEEDFGYA